MFEVVQRLTLEEQIALVEICRDIVKEAPLFQKTMPTGGKFHYLCTSVGQYGWLSDKKGYRYETQHPLTGNTFPAIPPMIAEITQQAVAQVGLSIRPETALINYYAADGNLGLHQDKTEVSRAPVVSISLGDDALFIKGGMQRSDPKEIITLKSGDILVMGAEHRLAYHGIKKILPGTAPLELGFKQAGRINITVRQVYE